VGHSWKLSSKEVNMKIAIIGCGKMGGAIAKRLSNEHELYLFDHHKRELPGTFCSSAKEAQEKSELIFICTKPQDLRTAALDVGEGVREKTVMSTLAGVTLESLKKSFPDSRCIRIMPNIAIGCGKGTVGIVDSQDFTQEEKKKIETLLKPLGFTHWLPEKLIDSFTALCGSAPAFILLMIESLVEGGIALGFDAKLGLKLTQEMIGGTLAILNESGKLPAELKWDITSPGGTTIAGLKTLEDEGVRAAMINALLATYERACELGEL
jgi:pyrroline-5-carboxylate reductase